MREGDWETTMLQSHEALGLALVTTASASSIADTV
jgi:hypothetical protein